ncbi:M23 family metallopeptidase [Castellaniella sp. MT123]|uniref:M23 family metallopeptidase n=1 Tax=Castellaniella sp. MT123 TaxID=3140381 RepID=UPI0031F44665
MTEGKAESTTRVRVTWHSNVRLLKWLGLLLALAAAAWGGAQWQARHAPDDGQRRALDARLRQESTALQDGIAGLAGKVGELQGRVLAMEAVRSRVAQAAGFAYSAPELAPAAGKAGATGGSVPQADSAQVLDDIPASEPSVTPIGSAEQLGRHIDALGQSLATQEDAYALVDAALSRQAGFQASLPTVSPVDYPALSSSFGWRRNPVNGRHTMHEGLDFVAPRGTPIHAASGGLVVRAGTQPGYGRMVEIDHGNGLRTRYAHASSLLVKAGDFVRQGQLIARVGSTGRSTGPHLHFEIRMADYPLDPSLFIQPSRQPLRAGESVHIAAADEVADAGGSRLR